MHCVTLKEKVMANTHHRAKHKSYVHQKHVAHQHHNHEQSIVTKQARSAGMPLAIAGALIGLLIGYLANKDSLVILAISFIAGALAGYLFGNNIDKAARKGR